MTSDGSFTLSRSQAPSFVASVSTLPERGVKLRPPNFHKASGAPSLSQFGLGKHDQAFIFSLTASQAIAYFVHKVFLLFSPPTAWRITSISSLDHPSRFSSIVPHISISLVDEQTVAVVRYAVLLDHVCELLSFCRPVYRSC